MRMQSLLCQLEDARLRFQLRSVEGYLRRNESPALTVTAASARQQQLDQLRAYWQAGQFPRRRGAADRTAPCFLDHEGRVCAVGHLLITSQQRPLASRIAQTANEARIRDMAVPALAQWAAQVGLSVDELALIQPAYCPVELEEGIRALLLAGLLSVLASAVAVVAHLWQWRRLTTHNLATPFAWARRIGVALAGVLASRFALYFRPVQIIGRWQVSPGLDGPVAPPRPCAAELVAWNAWLPLTSLVHLSLALAAIGLSGVALVIHAQLVLPQETRD